ncbi:MAG TPA: glycosyltransferase family 4 protein [Gemmatimonadales bacterium]
MRPLSVCLVCGEYPPGPHGGIGTMVQQLARGLAGLGYRVRVVGIYGAGFPGAARDMDGDVELWRLREPTHSAGWLVARYQLYRTIARWSRAREIDLVEVPDWAGAAAGWPRLPVPVVARLNGSATYFAAEMGTTVDPRLERFERVSLHRADFWCSASRYTAERTRRIFGLRSEPAAILYNATELPEREGGATLARRARKVVFTGTLARKKGVVSLVRAWPLVHAACPDAELHLLGKDDRLEGGASMMDHLRSLLPAEVRPSVHFHGHVPREELFAALRTARVAAFPSYAEAFAFAPLEAMACGCATVYSRRGSGPELIEDGRDGLLVDPDSPAEIAGAIQRLLVDDELALRIATAGRERVESAFSVQGFVAQSDALFRRCVSEFGSRSRAAEAPRVAVT